MALLFNFLAAFFAEDGKGISFGVLLTVLVVLAIIAVLLFIFRGRFRR